MKTYNQIIFAIILSMNGLFAHGRSLFNPSFAPPPPPPVNINSIQGDTICNSDSINIDLTSDQDPLTTYTWTVFSSPWISGASNGSGNNINQTLVNNGTTLNTVTYYITVTSGFNTDTTSFTIWVIPSVNALITSLQTTVNCDSADVRLNATSGALSPTYLWSTLATTPSIFVNAVGTYSVVVTSLGLCVDSSSITITNYTLPNVNAGPDQIFSCNADSIFLFGSSTTPGAGFLWTTSNGSILSGGPSGTQLNIGGPGTYILEIVDQTNNCYVYDTVQVTLQPTPTISFLDSIGASCGSSDGSIMVSASGGTPGYSFSWSGLPVTNDTLSNIPAGTYIATVTDTNGCASSISIVLGCTFIPPVVTNPLTIPQFLSPNGDGDNDIWIIQNLQFYPNHTLKIFNRWGNQIYSAAPYTNNWGGYPNIPYSIGQDIVPAGTYYYVLDVYGDQSDLRASYIEIQP
jgi:gliding motility-associated-like protein